RRTRPPPRGGRSQRPSRTLQAAAGAAVQVVEAIPHTTDSLEWRADPELHHPPRDAGSAGLRMAISDALLALEVDGRQDGIVQLLEDVPQTVGANLPKLDLPHGGEIGVGKLLSHKRQ